MCLDGSSIKVTVADEIQSDFLQKAAQKKSEIKAQIRRYVNEMTNAPGQQVGLDYLSCAKVTIDPQSLIDGNTHPKILDQRVMYKR